MGGVEPERAEWEVEVVEVVEEAEEEEDLSSGESEEAGSPGGRRWVAGSMSMEVGGEEKGV